MMTELPWWRHAVVYQIYPRSFADSNGDGVGDVNGIRSRLGYLADLGVDAIWLSPWYPSPMNDGGYDVADYRDINPTFGTLADAEQMIADAHAAGIRVVVDVVPNHTSSEHDWFQAALAAPSGSPERDRYMFRPGKGDDGELPPNNWQSVFGGPAWTRVSDGEWYLHLFDTSQPDLNWENPEVIDEFKSILRFWLDRGVDGFRVDVAHGLAKAAGLPDLSADQLSDILTSPARFDHPHWDQPGIHDIIRGWRTVLDDFDREHGRESMMVAEAWVHPDSLPNYLRPDEYHQSFNFDFLNSDWQASAQRAAISHAYEAAAAVGSVTTWTLSNHDVMRHPTRYGLPAGTDWRRWPLDGPHDILDAELGARRARAAALLMLALPGSTYLYQGEELGLPDVWDLPTDVLDDPVWEKSGHTQKGRDGCRVPLPWTEDEPSYGFSTIDAWLPQPQRFAPLAASTEDGQPDSMLNLYRQLLRVRRERLAEDEVLEWRDDVGGDDVIAFARGSGMLCIVNFGSPIDLPDGDILASSVPLIDGQLDTDAAVWIQPSA